MESFVVMAAVALMWLIFRKPIGEFFAGLDKERAESHQLGEKSNYLRQRNKLIDAINDRREEFQFLCVRMGTSPRLAYQRWLAVGNPYSDALANAAQKQFATALDLLTEAHRQAHEAVADAHALLTRQAARQTAGLISSGTSTAPATLLATSCFAA